MTLCALAALVATAADVDIVIVSGSADAAAAAQQSKDWAAKFAAAKSTLELPSGFPRVAKSDDYQGLKPGLSIVVAGFCPKATIKSVVAALNAVQSGVYSKPVRGISDADATACPRRTLSAYVAAGWVEKRGDKTPSGLHALTSGKSVIILAGDPVTDSWDDPTPMPEADDEHHEEASLERQVFADGEGYRVEAKATLWQPMNMCSTSTVYTYRVGLKDGKLKQLSATKAKPSQMCGE